MAATVLLLTTVDERISFIRRCNYEFKIRDFENLLWQLKFSKGTFEFLEQLFAHGLEVFVNEDCLRWNQ